MSTAELASNGAPILSTPSQIQIHPTHAELQALGRELCKKCPRGSHAAWQPPANRADPLVLLTESSQGRIPQLIPIRYGSAQDVKLRSASTPVIGRSLRTFTQDFNHEQAALSVPLPD